MATKDLLNYMIKVLVWLKIKLLCVDYLLKCRANALTGKAGVGIFISYSPRRDVKNAYINSLDGDCSFTNMYLQLIMRCVESIQMH